MFVEQQQLDAQIAGGRIAQVVEQPAVRGDARMQHQQTARATRLTMNREGIRRLAAEELGIPTSPYRFASDYEEFVDP